MSSLAWTCDAHGITTTGDCPRCDDELILALEDLTDTAPDRPVAAITSQKD